MNAATRGRADNDGVGIAYEVHERADGDWVVAVQGLGYARWGWGPMLDLLADRYRVVVLDNRGIGESDVPPGPYDAATMAGDVLAVLDDVGLARVHVIGTSLGGMIAQELAIDHADRVDHLVLVGTTPGGAGAHPLPQATRQLIERAPSMDPHEALEAFVGNALAPQVVRERPELVREVMGLRLAQPQDPAGWQAQAAAGTGYDGGGRQSAITAPTLVLHGDADRVVDVRNAEVLAGLIPQAQVTILPGGGHLLPFERPQALVDAIARFLGERGA